MSLNIKRIIIIISISLVLVIAGYFVVTNFYITQAKLALIEDYKKPRPSIGHIGFWNESGIDVLVKVLHPSGEIKWHSLSKSGGYFGSVEPGKLKVEVKIIDEDKWLVPYEVMIDENAKAEFSVHSDKLEPRSEIVVKQINCN